MIEPRLVERDPGEVGVLGRQPADGDLGHGRGVRPRVARDQDEGARERHGGDQEGSPDGGRHRGDGREALAALGQQPGDLGLSPGARRPRHESGDQPDELGRPQATRDRDVQGQGERQRRERQRQRRQGEGEQEALGQPEPAAEVAEQRHARRHHGGQHRRRPQLLDAHDASGPAPQALRALNSGVRSSTSTRSATTP